MVWEKQTPDANSPYGNIPAIDGSNIDLRREIAECLRVHGHEIFLRTRTDQRCPSHNNDDAFKEFDPRCEFCQGFGFMYKDTKLRSYRRPAFGTFGFTGAAMRFEPGTMGAEDTVWYFAHEAESVVGNHIIEVTTDDAGLATKPYNIERTHEIQQAHLTRERSGRPEFWEVLARARRIGK